MSLPGVERDSLPVHEHAAVNTAGPLPRPPLLYQRRDVRRDTNELLVIDLPEVVHIHGQTVSIADPPDGIDIPVSHAKGIDQQFNNSWRCFHLIFLLTNDRGHLQKRAQVFTMASTCLLPQKSCGHPLNDLGSFLHNSSHQILYRGQIFYSLSTFTTGNEHFFFIPSICGIHAFDLNQDQL